MRKSILVLVVVVLLLSLAVHASELFVAGDMVEVTGGVLNLREAPSDGQIVWTMSEGTQMEVISGPVEQGGYTWWHLSGHARSGWASEHRLVKVFIEMRIVPAGTTSPDNGSITLDNDIEIGTYLITQGQFEEIMRFNPSYYQDKANNPVEHVTWYDAVLFCNKLSVKEGLETYYNITNIKYRGYTNEEGHAQNIISATVTENEGRTGYRLPSKNEWVYAARGGTAGKDTVFSGSNTLDEVGWYWRNSGDDWLDGDYSLEIVRENNSRTHPVGLKKANELGLFDMSGSIMEWTNTRSSFGSFSFCCGGNFYRESNDSKVSAGSYYNKSFIYLTGFRIAKYH